MEDIRSTTAAIDDGSIGLFMCSLCVCAREREEVHIHGSTESRRRERERACMDTEHEDAANILKSK